MGKMEEEEPRQLGGSGETPIGYAVGLPGQVEEDGGEPSGERGPRAALGDQGREGGGTGENGHDAVTLLDKKLSFNSKIRKVQTDGGGMGAVISSMMQKSTSFTNKSENTAEKHSGDEMHVSNKLVGKDWNGGDSQPQDQEPVQPKSAADDDDDPMEDLRPKPLRKQVSWAEMKKKRNWEAAVLIYRNKRMEQRFEAAWAQPERLIFPLALYSVVWSLTYVQHKTIDSWLGNKLQIGLALAVLCIPLFTIIGCYTNRTKSFLSKNYHTFIGMNVLAPTMSTLAVSMYDQIVLPPEFLCPEKFYACPHHAMDAASVGIFLSSIAFLNMLSPCMVKYKLPLNIALFVLWNVGALSFNTSADSPWLSAFLAVNMFMVGLGTFVVGYNGESVYRQSVMVASNVYESKQAIENILTSMIPARLLGKPIKSPLVEHFERVTVMFCSFDKGAVTSYKNAEDFYNDVQELYMLFDEIVSKSGLFKIEHVGEDYVVTSPCVYLDTPESHQEDQTRLAGAACLLMAARLVHAGNSWQSSRTMKKGCDVFKFKAGAHLGKVTAGILGRSRKFYRLFGDTVVTAARLCQASTCGQVRCSVHMHETLGDVVPTRNTVEEVQLKGKGMVNTHLFMADDGVAERKACKGNPHKGLVRIRVIDQDKQEAPMPRQSNNEAGCFGLCGTTDSGAKDSAGKDEEHFKLAVDSTFEARKSSLLSFSHDGSMDISQDAMPVEHSQKWTERKLGPVSPLRGCFKLAESESRFQQTTIMTLRGSTLEYFWISRVLGLLAFSSVTTLGVNEGWELSWGDAEWETDKVTIPLWMGIVEAGIMFVSFFLEYPARRRNVTWWQLHALVAVQHVLFGIACTVAIISVNSIFTTSLPIAYMAQLACARLDIRLALATSLPFVAASIVEASLSKKLTVIWAQLTFIAMVLGVMVLVLWHRVHSERTRRVLWSSRQHAVEWRANMSRILCDMLPRQYSQALVMSTIKLKTSKAVASAAVTQEAVVLFSDLVGFTSLAEKLPPKELTDVMHHLWSCFDALVQKYGMHKIDTVGDAFIVIALVKDDQLELVANEMLTLAKWMVVTLADVSFVAGQPLGIRIGIDTGPIVTGIIGTLQRRFHAHGKVVSNAQRLEGLCPHGGVLVSQAVAEQCKADFPHLDQTVNHFEVGGRKVSMARSKSVKQGSRASVANAEALTRAHAANRSSQDKSSSKERSRELKAKGSMSSLVGSMDGESDSNVSVPENSLSGKSTSTSSIVRARWQKAVNVIGAVAFLRTESGPTEEDALESLFKQEQSSPNRKNEIDPEDDAEREKDLLRLAAKGEFDNSAKNLLQQLNNAGTEKKMTGAMRISLVPVKVDLDKEGSVSSTPKAGASEE